MRVRTGRWARFLPVFALMGLMALMATAVADDDLQLGSDVVPMFQAIDLKIDADRPDYSGSVRIELGVNRQTSTFQFHAEGQTLTRVELRDADGVIGVEHTAGEHGLITVTTERPLMPGEATLEIDFDNEFNTKAVGLYRMEQDGKGYLFTQLEAVDARKAFPCWDEPRFKIPWQMTLSVPETMTAISNTPVEKTSPSDGWKTLAFKRTKPMPSYLLAIASGRLESVPIEGMSIPGRVYTVEGQSHLAGLTVAMTSKILAALEDYFGKPYPYAKLDVIAVPEYWFGGMENPGAIVCDDAAILLDPKAASVGQKRNLAGLMAHEIAHMWFGDLVTMEWWDDLWLNESFATYMGQKITQQLFPEYEVDLARRRGVQFLMSRDARPSTKPVRGKIESMSSIFEDLGLAYGKGRTVLGMFEEWIGPEAFRKGVLSYIDKHAWGNAVADDLFTELSKAANKDLAKPMSSFLDQAGLPLIDMTVAGGSLTLSQRRFLNHGVEAPDQTWSVPVRLRYFDGDTVRSKTVMLDEKSRQLNLGGELAWVLPDDGAHGYYRWNLPREMLLEMAEHSADRLAPPERIVFLGNSAALLDAGLISGGDYLEILNGFAGDPEPDVVSTVVSGLGKIEGAFVPDELRGVFADYVRATLRPVLNRFGMEAVDGENETVALLRPRLIGWLGDEGRDPEVRLHATKLAKAYMKDPQSVDPAVAGTALGLAAIEGDRKLFDEYRQRFEKAATPVERRRYLSAMGSFENPKVREAALSYVLNGPLRPDEMLTIPGGTAKTEADHDHMFDWFLKNYEPMTSRMPAMMISFMPFLAGGCSTERLSIASDFFAENQVEGTQNNLRKVTESVNDCVNLRGREGEAVASYLKQFAKGG